MEKWFNVGKIVNTHGVRGEVRVISRTDFPEERYQAGSKLYLFSEKGGEPLELAVETHRKHKNFDLLTFQGYNDISEVEPLKNGLLKVNETQLGDLDEGEYYFHEIIGCFVKTADGEEIGPVKEILTPGANDVWVIKGAKGKEILIPFIDEIVKEIDVEKKMIVIEPMEGLLS
jgi:16S rRNA processing protein RimM